MCTCMCVYVRVFMCVCLCVSHTTMKLQIITHTINGNLFLLTIMRNTIRFILNFHRNSLFTKEHKVLTRQRL